MLCLSILLFPKFILCCNFCVGIYFFHFNNEEVRAFLVPPAHTDGDTFVYFPGSDVLHLGDVFRTTSYPIIDKFNGGTLRGTISALDIALSLAGAETKIIPGHGLEIVDRERIIKK